MSWRNLNKRQRHRYRKNGVSSAAASVGGALNAHNMRQTTLEIRSQCSISWVLPLENDAPGPAAVRPRLAAGSL